MPPAEASTPGGNGPDLTVNTAQAASGRGWQREGAEMSQRMRTISINDLGDARATAAPSGGSLWLRWVLAMAGGEILGFGVVAIVAALTRAVPMPAQIVSLVLAGAVEGLVLGLAQSLVLRRVVPALPWQEWALATALIAALAWALGQLPSSLMGAGDPAAPVSEPPLLVVLAAAALMGAGIGAWMGVGQWLVLRRYLRDSAFWVLANTIAWTAGLVVAFSGLGVIQAGDPMAVMVAVGVVTGVLMGATVGAITGLAVIAIRRRAAEPGPYR